MMIEYNLNWKYNNDLKLVCFPKIDGNYVRGLNDILQFQIEYDRNIPPEERESYMILKPESYKRYILGTKPDMMSAKKFVETYFLKYYLQSYNKQ